MSTLQRVAAAGILLIGLAGCDAVNTLVDGFKQAQAVETDLEKSTGLKPQVAFNWHNGHLVRVTVTFPRLDDSRSLREWAQAVRAAVAAEFKQPADNIVVGFSTGKS
jgi:hypothetical protein